MSNEQPKKIYTSRTIDGELDADELERIIDTLRNTLQFVLVGINETGRLFTVSRGVADDEIPDALVYFSGILIRRRGQQQQADEIASLSDKDRFRCPVCNDHIYVKGDIRAHMKAKAGIGCVCVCGSFLVPYLDSMSDLCMRIMTIDEIAALPDHTRNRMLAARREIQETRKERS